MCVVGPHRQRCAPQHQALTRAARSTAYTRVPWPVASGNAAKRVPKGQPHAPPAVDPFGVSGRLVGESAGDPANILKLAADLIAKLGAKFTYMTTDLEAFNTEPLV